MKFLLIFITITSYVAAQAQDNGFVPNVCFCVTSKGCDYNYGNVTMPPPPTESSENGESAAEESTQEGEVTTTTHSVSFPEGESTSTPEGEQETAVTNNRPAIEENDGSIDLRIGASSPSVAPDTGNTNNPRISPVWVGVKLGVTTQTKCSAGLDRCCPRNGFGCGIRYPPVAKAPKINGIGQSFYGAHPWTVDIRQSNNEFLGAGALIHHRHVLTVAHKVYYSVSVKCRVGVWNRLNSSQIFPIQEFTVQQANIAIHKGFSSFKTLINDIAILRLDAPGVTLGVYPTITTICLPNQQIVNQRCWVSGWGKGTFNSSDTYATIMREVNVPLVNNNDCQNTLRGTRLGGNFTLDSSFICAGGEPGNDACVGDGGGPLACSVNGRFYLAGLVAWGIGCGSTNPGVYVNVQKYVSWIQATIPELAKNEISQGKAKGTAPPKRG
ncbi:inactive CLIP domain-containing serine protease A3-like [Chironomus tepperi]|uniref:inactive CLIP domain-containing serine protease A3-like n=1 Tax=Chironomus tepperi TaxID=113505 RepID=UPI00391F8A90